MSRALERRVWKFVWGSENHDTYQFWRDVCTVVTAVLGNIVVKRDVIMRLTLSNTDYTFVASTKKITLVSPFDVLTAEQIYHIINLDTGAVIYNSDRRTYPISMVGAVITHTYDGTSMANGDRLQISVDDGTSGGGGGTSASYADNNFSTSGATNFFASAQPVFTIAKDTRYDLSGVAIDISVFTSGAMITLQVQRATAALGASYKDSLSPINVVVDTDPDLINISNIAGYSYARITAKSDNASDTAVDVPFYWIRGDIE